MRTNKRCIHRKVLVSRQFNAHLELKIIAEIIIFWYEIGLINHYDLKV